MERANYQYEPLPTPSQWGREERLFVSRLTDVLDDIYLKWGRISEKELSGSLRRKIESKADESELSQYSTMEQTAQAIEMAVGQMKIGGRNMLLGTSNSLRMTDGCLGSGYETTASAEELAGQKTVLSFDWTLSEGGGSVSIALGNRIGPEFELDGEKGHVSAEIVLPTGAQTARMTFCPSGLTGTLEISRAQWEKGSVETDWGQADGELVAGSNVEITKDRVRILTEQFQVGKGGNAYMALDDSGGYFPKLRSPQMAERYDGPGVIYVDGESVTDGESHFASLTDALAMVNGKWLDENVEIQVTDGYDEYGEVSIFGICGGGSLSIAGNCMVIYNQLTVKNCGIPISLTEIWAKHGGVAARIHACGYVFMENCVFETTDSSADVVEATGGSCLRMVGCTMAAGNFSLRGKHGSRITLQNCTGNRNICSEGAYISGNGTLPSGSASSVTTTSYQCGYVNVNGTVSRGSGAGTIPSRSAEGSEDVGYAVRTAYYQSVWSSGNGYIYQGIAGDYGQISGCMWFSVAHLAGKTVASAKLRLTRVAGYGRSGAVSVRLVGLGPGCTGPGTTLVWKNAYGVLGTIAPGTTKAFTLPPAAAQDLINGSIAGLALVTVDTQVQSGLNYSINYARFYGTAGNENTKPQLIITI